MGLEGAASASDHLGRPRPVGSAGGHVKMLLPPKAVTAFRFEVASTEQFEPIIWRI